MTTHASSSSHPSPTAIARLQLLARTTAVISGRPWPPELWPPKTDPSPNKKAHHRHVSAFGPGEWSLSASGICKRSLDRTTSIKMTMLVSRGTPASGIRMDHKG